MRTLVTGSSGFVAGHLPEFDEGLYIDVLDGADVCDPETQQRILEFDPEVVFHLAAKHFIPWCESHPDETARTNVTGTAKVLQACGPSLRSFVLASSAAVYGFDPLPISESHPVFGQGVYAWSKQAAESLLVQAAQRRPQVRCVAARLFNVVGVGDGQAHVLPSMVDGLCGGRVATLGNVWPKRDYIHVADVAEALVFLSERAPIGYSKFNVGTGSGTTVRELFGLVCDELGAGIAYEADSGRTDDGDLVSDPSALASLGWRARRTLRQAVHEVVLDGRKGVR